MSHLNQYFDLHSKSCNSVGYADNWEMMPLNSCTNYYWAIKDLQVVYSEHRKDILDYMEKGVYKENLFIDNIYSPQFLTRYIYRTVNFTLVYCISDINKSRVLRVFDNTREVRL